MHKGSSNEYRRGPGPGAHRPKGCSGCGKVMMDALCCG